MPTGAGTKQNQALRKTKVHSLYPHKNTTHSTITNSHALRKSVQASKETILNI